MSTFPSVDKQGAFEGKQGSLKEVWGKWCALEGKGGALEAEEGATGGELPPLRKKQQGPFREVEQVLCQRYRPFQPSLRVQTDFLEVDNARKDMQLSERLARVSDETYATIEKLLFLLHNLQTLHLWSS